VSSGIALVVAHIGYEDLGALQPCLDDLGLASRVLHREMLRGDEPLEGVSSLLSMGSTLDPVGGELRHSREKLLLRRAHGQGVRVVGICFGAQLLAACLGGRVFRLPEARAGWLPAADHPGDIPDNVRVFFWNSFGFSPPPGSEVIASHGEACTAFRNGSVLGLQFHADVTPSLLSRWIADEGECPCADHRRRDWLQRCSGEMRSSAVLARTLVSRHLSVSAASRRRHSPGLEGRQAPTPPTSGAVVEPRQARSS
jgi:GMP synthase-like glutamine amidotransferase